MKAQKPIVKKIKGWRYVKHFTPTGDWEEWDIGNITSVTKSRDGVYYCDAPGIHSCLTSVESVRKLFPTFPG